MQSFSDPLLSSSPALTLLEFTQMITRHLNAAPQLSRRWVVAEISRIGQHGAHYYCELIHKDERGATVARIRGTIWGSNWIYIREKFRAATGHDPAAGMKVMLNLSAGHSPAYGLSANITDIDPAYTLGDAERRRREILARLKREGLLERNRSLTLPPDPQRIAVISSRSAAGYGDFMNQLEASGYAFYPLLYTAALQGSRTAPSVIDALERIEMAVDFWDCVVIIRGGGATDDLNSFDDLELARRVASFPLPVVVGIGHERDRTVLDEIAHTRCKTPTAVAAFLIEALQRAEQRAEQLTRAAVDFARLSFMGERRRLGELGATLPHLAPRRLDAEGHRLTVAGEMLARLTMRVTAEADRELTLFASRIESASRMAIAGRRERLAAIPGCLAQAMQSRIRMEEQRLASREGMISVLGPEATLKRGYTLTLLDGKAVRSVTAIPPGARLVTRFADGEAELLFDPPNA